ncbi:MAG: hypothetical protein SF162_10595 [bacterium]|nr:hypothetical protein [bacterium]
MSAAPGPHDLRLALESLVEGLEQRRREAADRAKQGYTQDWRFDYFYRGVVKTYEDVLADLRELLVTGDDQPQPIPQPPITYRAVSEGEIAALLEKAGVYARSVTLHSDGAVTAVFARMGTTPHDERIARLKGVDPRLVILDVGKLSATGEPFIDFGLLYDLD